MFRPVNVVRKTSTTPECDSGGCNSQHAARRTQRQQHTSHDYRLNRGMGWRSRYRFETVEIYLSISMDKHDNVIGTVRCVMHNLHSGARRSVNTIMLQRE